ncbi:DUF1697 domain-containing protein [Blastopirellula sp. JC732]|uniref:DUF1697 domain-containing protein n=1 Tax=Blastopirellula sediminis TaxID=2894196 RepID=A0A9X1SGF4_9BACT|nr:DUF1697 domain-containing protein [Blastopirellula sediminis]MCC9606557.1 DUF1697 domain-containing protein [Blastopirellula sediminis]MCC9630145.1 DUF1697 domain-containing protein [Blastopirellula sediminis]
MPSYCAFFRGINVGGNNQLPMKELTAILESLGCTQVKTYIQSGNAAFDSKSRSRTKLATEITAAIEQAKGFAPLVVLLEQHQLKTIVAANPFPEAEDDHKSLHFFFLTDKAKKPDLAALETLKAADESFQLKDDVFYLHAPSGIGRSKLAAKVDRHLGVATTARNWRTVSTMLELASA